MNRYRAGLHVPGNVLVACRVCNDEKRRDDSLEVLTLATSGWASFLSHNGMSCGKDCKTCLYWRNRWASEEERTIQLKENLQRIISFRESFPEFQKVHLALIETLPVLLTKLYSDCQTFAKREIESLLERFKQDSAIQF
jgi:hypothetical protein